MQLYTLEAFLARLANSHHASSFVLKGGVLLAVFGERRPTGDIDLQAQSADNDPESIGAIVREIAKLGLDDGVVFDAAASSAEVIREEHEYSGVRVTMMAHLATARLHLHVDVSVGDPISPSPMSVRLPRLLGGEIVLRGYPLAMVYAEKIVTAVARGTISTRWRDFADVSLLARHHAIDGTELVRSVRGVASHRGVDLAPLATVLSGYGPIGQQRWSAWRRKQRLDDRLPERFDDVVLDVIKFADPSVIGSAVGLSWDPAKSSWM
jgi:hypothetical protein